MCSPVPPTCQFPCEDNDSRDWLWQALEPVFIPCGHQPLPLGLPLDDIYTMMTLVLRFCCYCKHDAKKLPIIIYQVQPQNLPPSFSGIIGPKQAMLVATWQWNDSLSQVHFCGCLESYYYELPTLFWLTSSFRATLCLLPVVFLILIIAYPSGIKLYKSFW